MTHSAPGSSPEVLEDQISDLLAGLGLRAFGLQGFRFGFEGSGL